MAEQSSNLWSERQFFDFLTSQDEKWEFVDGQPVMMAGANQRHQDIAANILASLRTQLRGTKCRPTAANTGVASSGGNVRFPDVVVDCGPRDDQAMMATVPMLVIEVLSPSRRSIDSHLMVEEYKCHPRIMYVLLIDTDQAAALLHLRDEDGWVSNLCDDIKGVIDFPGIGASLAMADIYEGLDIEPHAACVDV